ncbi:MULTISPECIES: hypothetical protein [unclassified Candidatus Frackibacter]|uniref:hypothetical protein n=1 Tax=unclassified Candidatus Frackibacter TaxID=2648818 RepID=UPI000792CBEE|nr:MULTISPECIES: hypothetical protein [unclassified Candidatus Frackibacter]KXS40494.1 MAG: hypothetical protein AWU54_1956 [Candidatus Frackibacter sp. T328-2]SDC64655.1 hypothetical protein SAMN04515661_11751 [Candidatus Frackibacter sp. WG11]SEM77314.1 hypothetical protein SAMN04488698_11612 [Candidatus Frackibacter sp. WG12]SFL88759.1 hypothetical protein SAMN04488699_11850 [Candidatus Frackibacter sp. WG13]
MVLESLSTVLLLAILVEMVTNTFKSIFSIKGSRSKMIAVMIGITVCISTQIGILHKLDVDIYYDVIDYIITGIIISRGSHAIHDISSGLKNHLQKK